jgi:hypothetical protein
MVKTGVMRDVRAIVAYVYAMLIIGTGVFFLVSLERISRHASARDDSALDLSATDSLQGQESPKSSATRLNAIWRSETSQT